MNIWSNTLTVAVWAGSLTLLSFSVGLYLKRSWTAGFLSALAAPVILLPMAFAGGLGAMTLGEIVVRGGLNPSGLGNGGGAYVNAIADLIMLVTPFAMLTLYFRYELLFERETERYDALALPKIRAVILENRKRVSIPIRKNSSPKLMERKFGHHCLTREAMGRPKLPRRFAKHPHPESRPTHEPDPSEA